MIVDYFALDETEASSDDGDAGKHVSLTKEITDIVRLTGPAYTKL